MIKNLGWWVFATFLVLVALNTKITLDFEKKNVPVVETIDHSIKQIEDLYIPLGVHSYVKSAHASQVGDLLHLYGGVIYVDENGGEIKTKSATLDLKTKVVRISSKSITIQ